MNGETHPSLSAVKDCQDLDMGSRQAENGASDHAGEASNAGDTGMAIVSRGTGQISEVQSQYNPQ